MFFFFTPTSSSQKLFFVRLLVDVVVVMVVFSFRILVSTIGSIIAVAQMAPNPMVNAKVLAEMEKIDFDALVVST